MGTSCTLVTSFTLTSRRPTGPARHSAPRVMIMCPRWLHRQSVNRPDSVGWNAVKRRLFHNRLRQRPVWHWRRWLTRHTLPSLVRNTLGAFFQDDKLRMRANYNFWLRLEQQAPSTSRWPTCRLWPKAADIMPCWIMSLNSLAAFPSYMISTIKFGRYRWRPTVHLRGRGSRVTVFNFF